MEQDQPQIPLAAAAPALPPRLSPDQLRELHDARARSGKIRRTIGVAKFDAWATAIFAGITLLGTAFSFSAPVLMLGIVMAFVAFRSFKGRAMLTAFDPRAAKLLGWNQIVLGVGLIVYGAWNIHSAATGPAPFGDVVAQEPQTKEILAPYGEIGRSITEAVYGGVIIVGIFAQGATALYYFSREKYIRAHTQHTPLWIIQLQQAGFNL